MKFKEAIAQTPDLKEAWQEGFGALRRADKKHVDAEDTRSIKGSVNVEQCLETKYRDQRQWDYGVGLQPANLKEEVVYWIEIHPANDGEVRVVLEKLASLQRWLREDGRKLNAMRRAFIWVSSGKTSFTLTAPQQKQFALRGLQQTGRFFRIPAMFVI